MRSRSLSPHPAGLLLVALIGLILPASASAQQPDPFADRIGGDLFGLRSGLAEHGINIYGSVTQFYPGVTSGGIEETFRYGGRTDLFLHIDGGKAGLWQGLFIDLHNETLFGQSINGFTGALLPASIAQAVPQLNGPINALTGVKITQAFSENFAVFFGKINTLDGFSQQFAGGFGRDAFMNTSFVFPTVLAKVVPYSTFGAGAAVLVEGLPVLSFTVFDANDTPTTSGFNTFFEDGVSLVAQATLPIKLGDLPGHHTVYGVYYNKPSANLDDLPYLLIRALRDPTLPPPEKKQDSWAFVYQFDQMLLHAGTDPRKGWGVFGSMGLSDGNPNPIKYGLNIGLGGTSPIPGRDMDTFGVAYAYNGISESLKNLAPNLLPLRDERAIELFYNINLTPWFVLTPDFQWVTPTRDRVEAATVFGLRGQLRF